MPRPRNNRILLFTCALALASAAYAAVPVAPPAPKPEEKPATVATGKVSVAPTSEITVDDFGALDAGKGGYPADIWKGSNRKDIADYLAHTPSGMVHAALNAPLVKLLLTKAKMPEGKNEGDDLLTLRLRALIKLGKEQQAIEVIQSLPAQYINENLEKLRVEILLFKPDVPAGCEAAGKASAKYDNTYWHKLNIFCNAYNKKFDDVQLGLDLLEEEQKDKPDSFFSEIVAKLKDSGKEIKSYPSTPSLLEWGILLATEKEKFPVTLLSHAPLPVLKALAADKEASVEIHATALETLVLYNLEDAAKLREAYAAFSFSAKELATSPHKQESFKGVKGRALLYQMANHAEDQTKRVEILSKALSLYDDAKLLPLTYKAFLPAWQKAADKASQAEEETQSLAPDILAALWSNGKTEDAQGFVNNRKDDLAKYLARALPQLQQAKPLPPVDLAPPTDSNDREMKRLFRLYAVLVALGQETKPLPLWYDETVNYTAEQPFPQLFTALRKAAAANRKGEVLLLSAIIIDDKDISRLSDENVAEVIHALQQAGFEQEARALATEAVIYSLR